MTRHGQFIILVSVVLVASLFTSTLPPPARAELSVRTPRHLAANSSDPKGAAPQPMPEPTICVAGGICPGLIGRVPNAAINQAICTQDPGGGWGQRCYPNVPASWWNIRRDWLSLSNPGEPYHPLFNGLVWKCGCP